MIEEVKFYLKIDGNELDEAITKSIDRGKAYLSRLTGTIIDFETDDLAKQLLLDWCRYAINNSLEFFQENFSSDILLLQLQEGLKAQTEVVISG